MKRILYLIGMACLALAFLTTSAELAVRMIVAGQDANQGEGGGWLVSTLYVWKTVAPRSLYALTNSAIWPFAQPLLQFPGWLLFGVPGLILSLLFRTPRDDEPEPLTTKALAQAHEESLFLFDELARAAHIEGYTRTQEDSYPSNPLDTIPAEAHFADEDIEPQLLPERDYLLGPAPKSQAKDSEPDSGPD